MVRKSVIIGAMNPRKYTEYDYINFLITTTVTTPQNELSNSRLTQANYFRRVRSITNTCHLRQRLHSTPRMTI